MPKASMSSRFAPLAAIPFLAACASAPAPSSPWWEKPGGTRTDFAMANEHCAGAASRATPTPRADMIEGGIVVPNNSIDRPPRPYVSSVAERAYMDCMAKEGWRPAREK
jgi:hypothetical protein